jgi:hypothetical protein
MTPSVNRTSTIEPNCEKNNYENKKVTMAKMIQNLISLTILLKNMKSFLRNPTHHEGISNNMKGA